MNWTLNTPPAMFEPGRTGTLPLRRMEVTSIFVTESPLASALNCIVIGAPGTVTQFASQALGLDTTSAVVVVTFVP